MKIQKEHFDHMHHAIHATVRHFGFDRIETHRQNLKRDGRVRDVEKRLRHDLLRHAGLSQFVCDSVYPYANDEHLDTALRRIMALEGLA